jgi:hypothetical protein
VLVQGEIGRCLRACVIAICVGTIGCAAFAPTAYAAEQRHYERVSPADKGHGDIIADGETTVASRLGDAVAFASRTLFGDAEGSGVVGQTAYLARRSDGGWAAHAITPMSKPDAVQTLLASTKVEVFSDDLRSALVWGYDLPGVTGDTPDRENLYLEDTATGALRPISVSQAAPLLFTDFLDPNIWGVSGDAKHLAFVTATQMLPDAAPGVPNAYAWDDGSLSLAGVLPNGSVPAGGSTVAPVDYRGAMSADGSRLVFSSPADGTPPQLYLRLDGRRTVWVSAQEGSDRSEPANVKFEGMTPDGGNVFFVTDSPLLDEDITPGPDLYRYTDSADPDTDANLTLISHDGSALDDPVLGAPLVGMSDDGTRVYYHTITGELRVWDNGDTRLISADVFRDGEPKRQLTVTTARPGFGRVSPDGRWLVFISNSTAGADQVHALTGQVTNGHFELYVYNLRGDIAGDAALSCISCPSGAATSDVSVTPGAASGLSLAYAAVRPRFLSDDGKAFFSTTEALLPRQDVNGVADTYEYDAESGTLSLLSSGRGSEPTEFADASASGDDVFLVTRQRLVAADQDAFTDLYDARVGPPAPDQPIAGTPPCDGEGCQPPLSAAPTDDPLGSLSLLGGGAGLPRHRLLTARNQASFVGATGSVRVKLGAGGRLEWRGRGLVRGSVQRGAAGAVKLRLRLGIRARTRLRQTRSYVTTAHLTFHAANRTVTRTNIRVTFSAAKGR